MGAVSDDHHIQPPLPNSLWYCPRSGAGMAACNRCMCMVGFHADLGFSARHGGLRDAGTGGNGLFTLCFHSSLWRGKCLKHLSE